MIFEQFYLGCLAHASYLIGSEGVAAVVDPQRDVGIYLDAARERGLRIAHIIETHLHADFVSGHQELAARTGAAIYLGEGSGATFPHHAAREGDEIGFGKIRLRFLQTPGHTLESVSVVVTDLERGETPAAVLTGDTLFIGDVGRPDLSESHTPQELARMLYDSLREKILKLPDETLVYPAHGAGSMCGRNISADRNSTIGRERRTNYALQPMEREAFASMMTQDLPARPEYFKQDVDYNRRGAAPLESLPPLATLSPHDAQARQSAGATILDTRSAMEYASGHIPRSIQIGLGRAVRVVGRRAAGARPRTDPGGGRPKDSRRGAHALGARGHRARRGRDRWRHRGLGGGGTAAGDDAPDYRAGFTRGPWRIPDPGCAPPGGMEERPYRWRRTAPAGLARRRSGAPRPLAPCRRTLQERIP